jgi:hypothetical protein
MLTSHPSIVERTSRVLQWAFDIVFMAGAVCVAGYVAITIGYVATILGSPANRFAAVR